MAIYRTSDPLGGARVYAHFFCVNTNLRSIEKICNLYRKDSDVVIHRSVNARKPHWKPIYRVQIPQTLLLETISALLPYLTNKAPQAEVMLNYLITRYTKSIKMSDKVYNDYRDDIARLKVA